MNFINNENVIIQNSLLIPLSEECNKYVFQNCRNKWITKDGIEIEVKDMSTKHIENSIAMIDNICSKECISVNSHEIYNILNEELIRRKINANKVNEWILKENKLPQQDTVILVTIKDDKGENYVRSAQYWNDHRFHTLNNFGFASDITDDVIAWQLLPKPYNENIHS